MENSERPDVSRYSRKPLLLVLERYILDCIGYLPDQQRAVMREWVQKAFGGGEDWKKTLREQLKLDDILDDNLRDMWKQNQDIARENAAVLSPEEFARMVVDENWADQVDAYPPE